MPRVIKIPTKIDPDILKYSLYQKKKRQWISNTKIVKKAVLNIINEDIR